MKIALHDNYLSERGTSIALFDYAFYLQRLFGFSCYIFFEETNSFNNKEVINKFRNHFTLCPYSGGFQAIDPVLQANRIDLLYIIKSGENDGKISQNNKTCVHAVFPCDSQIHKHGNVYAYVSRWLSGSCSGGFSVCPAFTQLTNNASRLAPETQHTFRSCGFWPLRRIRYF